LNALDIFAMPSLNEGMGVAAVEAAAAGLPIIASAAGGLSEVVDSGCNGLLVQVGDPAMLADAILELAGDLERRLQMGREGRRRAVHNWSMELMAQRTLKLYYDCLNRKHADAVVHAQK
jgi:glycosyltransferase involved in cell wall biosynthesis